MANSVIFIHPDGTSPSHYAAARFLYEGPDGRLNWDMMSNAGVYLGHMEDQLTGTSNAGAVTHALGVKAPARSFGLDANGDPLVSLSGQVGTTIMEEAIAAGKGTAVINSGFIAEPGTGAFLAEVENRSDRAGITLQIVESGVDVILGGGEVDYLPTGTVGRFGEAGTRTDGRNLITEAQAAGYTVVYTLAELQQAVAAGAEKVLGIFAAQDTYNDGTEEQNDVLGLGNYGQPGNENPPTVAEMLDAAIAILSENSDKRDNGFFIVLEEEATDNFGNPNNAAGTLEATKRADDAIGLAMDYIDRNPNTLLVTAADSDAGGLEVRDPRDPERTVGTVGSNPTQADRSDSIDLFLDGVDGSDTAPFVSAPDANGVTYPFGISWVATPDFPGSIVARAHGLNADQLPSTVDNTGIYRLMYETLFETELETLPPAPEPTPAPPATQSTGNVIFIHPDGASPSHFGAARFLDQGPDGLLNWDMMSHAGVYLGHMENRLTGTSNSGAVTHAMGVKAPAASFGLDENGNPVVSLSGRAGVTIMEEAIAANKATAVINSGFIAEPGTGAFLAEVENRSDRAGITLQIVESGVDVILGGGEVDYLPVGVTGFFGAEGTRTDGRNLITEAETAGYTVVYTLAQLNQAVLDGAEKVLGVFAAEDTYNDTTEEALAAAGLENYGQPGNENPPTIAQMLDAAIAILSENSGKRENGFFIVLEEEGTDNFGNNNNAAGTLEALKRADDAIGVAMDFVRNVDPNTLVITAADSDAGGLEVVDVAPDGNVGAVGVPFGTNPTTIPGASNLIDGVDGRGTAPFVSQPAGNGNVYPFGIAWAGTPDFPGSIVSKAFGLNADLLPSTLDNTQIYEIMYRTLFGDTLPTVTVNDVEVQEGDSGRAIAALTLSLSGASEGEVRVNYETEALSADETDFDAVAGQAVFAPGSTTTTVEVAVNGDTVDEADEQFALNLLIAQGAVLAEDTTGLVTILDDDLPTGGGDGDGDGDGDTPLPTSGTAQRDRFRGNAENNLFRGLGGNDRIAGLGGNDRLFGNGGGDRLLGGIGNDRLNGGAGNDVVLGNAGDDRIIGGPGNDRLNGGAGNDTVLGNAGNDRLLGGAGNDDLDGGLGRDVYIGRAGNDVFTIRRGRGADVIRDLGEGDRIRLDAGLQFNRLEFNQVGNNVAIFFNGDRLATVRGVEVSDLTASTFI